MQFFLLSNWNLLNDIHIWIEFTIPSLYFTDNLHRLDAIEQTMKFTFEFGNTIEWPSFSFQRTLFNFTMHAWISIFETKKWNKTDHTWIEGGFFFFFKNSWVKRNCRKSIFIGCSIHNQFKSNIYLILFWKPWSGRLSHTC